MIDSGASLKSRQENAFIEQINAGIADEEERFAQGERSDEIDDDRIEGHFEPDDLRSNIDDAE